MGFKCKRQIIESVQVPDRKRLKRYLGITKTMVRCRGYNGGNAMFCIKCGTEIEDDSQFCKKCGVSVYRKTGGVCSKCGIEIEDDSVFCRNCGASVQQKEETDYTQIYPYVTKIHAGEKQNTRVIHMIGSSSTGIGSNIEKIVGLIGGIMMIMSGYMDYISINYIGRYNFRLCERSEDWKILVGLVIASIIAVFIDASFF